MTANKKYLAYTYYAKWIRLNLKYYGGRCKNQTLGIHPNRTEYTSDEMIHRPS